MDARTGQSRLSNTSGMVMGNKALRIARSTAGGSKNALSGNEYLLPVFDALGNVSGYELSMDPAKLEGLQQDTQGLAGWQSSFGEVTFDPSLPAFGNLVFGEGNKQSCRWPAFLVGQFGEGGPEGA